MSQAVPPWVKAKGFSNWKDYMASLRDMRGKHHDKTLGTVQQHRYAMRKTAEGINPRIPDKYVLWDMELQKPLAYDSSKIRLLTRAKLKNYEGGYTSKFLTHQRYRVFLSSNIKNPRKKKPRKKNPIAIYNKPKKYIHPKGVHLPVTDVEIRYRRTSGQYAGKLFRHHFKAGVVLFGLPDGNILLASTGGRKLWGTV